jgi:Rieske Fe-S protein
MDETFDTSRRTFLAGACSLLALGFGAALLADDAQAATGIKRLPDGRVQLTLAKIPSLAKVNGVANLGNVKGIPTAVVRTASTTYAALDLRCPHQGVTVQQDGMNWDCPAHGSMFALNGTLERGPARTGLAKVPAVRRKGTLTVG